jgi:hypothetical protein
MERESLSFADDGLIYVRAQKRNAAGFAAPSDRVLDLISAGKPASLDP